MTHLVASPVYGRRPAEDESRGTMIWFNEEKDHGFISTEAGERLHVRGDAFIDGLSPKGRCGGVLVEFQVSAYGESREAEQCVIVEEESPARARRRYSARSAP